MAIRRLRTPFVGNRKKRQKQLTSLRKMLGRMMQVERLEERQLLAIGPQLIGIQPNNGELLKEGDVRPVAPNELTFRFDQNQRFDDTFLQQTGIQITRANLDSDFRQASVTSDLNTGGAVQVTFTATRYGQEGNNIQIVVNKSNQGAPGLPTVSVTTTTTGTTTTNIITANLNIFPGYVSTALDLVNAINNNPAARALVLASVPANEGSIKVGDRQINYSPLPLSGANDIVIKPGFIGHGEDPDQNQIVVRFAEPLPDDLYRIDVFGAVQNLALRNTDGISSSSESRWPCSSAASACIRRHRS